MTLLTQTSANNIIDISNRFVTANATAPALSASITFDPSIHDAVSELQALWSATSTLIKSSRDSLYEFLSVTYEFGKRYENDNTTFANLRDAVRLLYPSAKEKKRVKDKNAFELLLAAAMGIEQASLRSKYNSLLLSASVASVPADRESFKSWLIESGGIVKALKDTVTSMHESKQTAPAKPRTLDSLSGDLIANYAHMELENRTFAAQHKGFTVVLYYTKPGTQVAARVAILDDSSAVEIAIKKAHSLTPAYINNQAAA